MTVRRRGVMEKCTFCIQRIHKAEDKAKSEGREVVDGEFTTACAQACPASAITFGRVDNPESLVSQMARVHGHGQASGILSSQLSKTSMRRVSRGDPV